MIPSPSSTTPTSEEAQDPVMFGWTFHQSHDQATVLFLVPQTISSKDLDIQIGTNYIIAAVKSQPAIIKAKLYGRINTHTSTWRIGDKNKPASKRRSRSLRRSSHHPSSAQAPSTSGHALPTDPPRAEQNASSSTGATPGPPSPDHRFSHSRHSDHDGAAHSPGYFESPPPSYSSMTASTSSLRSGSSFEMLPSIQHSRQPSGLRSEAFSSSLTNWSSSSSEMGSSDSAAAMARSTVLSEPDSFSSHRSDPFQAASAPRRVRSIADVSAQGSLPDDDFSSGMHSSIASLATGRSDNSDPVGHAKGHSGDDGISSRGASSPSVSAPATAASVAEESEDAEAEERVGFPAVRLVTIHLDKIDTGMWPLLVIGPAPLQNEKLPPRLRRAGQQKDPSSWSAGVTESLIAEQARRAARDRNERQRQHNAERELTKALGEALGTASEEEGRGAGFSGSRAGVQAYLDSLSASAHDSDPENDEDGMEPSTSTLSIVSTNSDESATVLGSRAASLAPSRTLEASELDRPGDGDQSNAPRGDSEDDEAEELRELELEAKFNMDPTTLSLIGLQVANSAPKPLLDVPVLGNTGFRAASHWALPEAFEYFARAWRQADVALAVERLVQDYLPFLPELAGNDSPPSSLEASTTAVKAPEMAHTSSADTFRPEALSPGAATSGPKRPSRTNAGVSSQRQRLIASLGGQKALARLYLSYARLHLPSCADSRSPLAFPHGQLNSPFVSGRTMTMQRTNMLGRKPSFNLARSQSSRASSVASSRNGASPSKRSKQPSSPASAHFSRGPSPPLSPSDGAEAIDLFTGHAPAAIRMPGPLHFLHEAVRLDPGISTQVTALEWQEATTIEEEELEAKRLEKEALNQAEEMGSLAGESEMGDLVFDSDGEIAASKRGRRRKRSLKATETTGVLGWMFGSGPEPSQRKGKTSRRQKHGRRTYSRSVEEEGGMIAFVSGAALLSVALAGGVAAVGWWRRASGALPTSS